VSCYRVQVTLYATEIWLCCNKILINFYKIEHETIICVSRRSLCMITFYKIGLCQEMRLERALLSGIIFRKYFKRLSVFNIFMQYIIKLYLKIVHERYRKIECDRGDRYNIEYYNSYKKKIERKFLKNIIKIHKLHYTFYLHRHIGIRKSF